MMEVKHNTPVDFNDLMTSNGDVRSNNMHDMADLAAGSKLKTDLLNSNELSRNGVLSGVTNGSNSFDNAAETIDLDSDIDLGDPVTSELEEALLAEDGANVVDELLAEVVPKAANIFESKTEVLSSVGCSDRVRDAGDDLDTLLSKINDLEDCIETARDASSKEELAHDTGTGAAAASTIEQTAEASTVCENASTNSTCATLEEFEKEHVTEHKVIEEYKDSEAAVEAKFVDSKHALDSDKKLINEEAEITAGCTETVVSNAVETEPVGAVTQGSSVSDDAAENADINNSVVTNETSTPDEIDKTTSSPAEIDNTKSSPAEIKSKEQKAVDETTEDVEIPTLTLDDDDDDEIMRIVETTEAEKETKALNPIDSSTDAKKDSTSSTNLDADDSDDDIIFVADKPKCSKEETSGAEEKERNASEPAPSSAEETKQNAAAVQEDDDVVLLDDDDDDDVIEQKERTPEKSDGTHEKKNVDELTKKDVLQQESANSKSVEDAVSADDNVTEQNVVKSDETVLKVEQEASQKTGDSKGDSTTESATEVEANKNKTDLCADNSDNARDDFVAEKTDAADKGLAKLKSDYTDETNSNCSSSSNLLQETQAINETGEGEEAEVENDNDEDEEAEADADADDVEGGGDGDLDLGEDVVALGEETKDSDEKETAPPAKRMRLSEDSANEVKAAETEESRSSCKSSDMLQTGETNIKKDLEVEEKNQIIEIAVSIAVKRSHESLKEDDDEKFEEAVEEVVVKKSKTEESEEKLCEETTMMAKETSEEKVVKSEEERTEHKSEKKAADNIEESVTEVYSVPEIKAVPSNIPIPLYPPPKFGESVAPLSLDFFKRFRKTFDKMTKNDLEELVLQKVVEAIVHKSEFAEMRDIIEKQEKMIVSHRNKIAELSKQFRDLDMVHNRVVKDIELKNTQFPMPVKITRAVGLQVYIPNKRNTEPTVNATVYPTPTPTTPTSSVPRSPQRPASLPMAPAAARVPSSGDLRSNNSALASAAAAAAINSRRGCAQKVTPQRPIDGSINNNTNNNTNNTTMLSTTQVAPGVYRSGNGSQSPLTQGTQVPPQNVHRVLNKGVAMQRNRFPGPTPTEQQRQQQQLQKLHLARQQAQTVNQRKLVTKPTQTSGHIIPQQQQYRRPEGSTPGVDIHLSQQLPAGVSITPAKPKEKAVIDLTDEDDAGQAQAAAAAQMRTRLPTQPPNNNLGSAAPYMNNRTVPPLTRMPTPTQLPTKPNVSGRPQLDNMQTSKSNNNALLTHISTPPGTSITRVHITSANVATQRTKYGHPAPLPVTPIQSFNPAWKLPPPRPTIRISNLDNGIVISWTMEEAMDRHAECVSYQIYAYQETAGPPMVDSWRHVGDVKAMLLPMAVTLTQFQEGQRYYFAVRAVDVHQRFGPFSMPKTWT